MKRIQLGNDEEGCVHCELARLIGWYVQARLESNEITPVWLLHSALLRLAGEIAMQMADEDEVAGMTKQ